MKLTKEQLLDKHNTDFRLTHVDYDENEDFSNLNLELLYTSNKSVIHHVMFTAKELNKLLKHDVLFYCDYMDQGFDEITDFEKKYKSYSDLIRDTCDIDEENDTVEYCTGESIFVNVNNYNKIFNLK